MEEFKDKLKLQNLTIALGCFLLSAFSFVDAIGEAELIPWFAPVTGGSNWQSTWRGFTFGAAIGTLVYMVVVLIRNIWAMHNEAALKKVYVKSNDERTEQICKSAQSAAYRTVLLLQLVAVIITGYFSISISLTLLVSLWVTALLGPVYKLYFSHKF